MPRKACRTPGHIQVAHGQAGQRRDAARQEPGNVDAQTRFSIDWPPRFQSRTCNPADPLFVGKKAAGHIPTENTLRALSNATAGLGNYRPVGMLKRAGQ